MRFLIRAVMCAVLATAFTMLGASWATATSDGARSEEIFDIREFTLEDIPTLLGWIDSPQTLAQWAGAGIAFPLSAAALAEYVTKRRRTGPHAYKAVRRSDGALVGYAELTHVGEIKGMAEITHLIVAPDYRRRGVATALLRYLLRRAFQQLGLEFVYLAAHSDNAGARACYEQVGFLPTGIEFGKPRPIEGPSGTTILAMHLQQWADSTAREKRRS